VAGIGVVALFYFYFARSFGYFQVDPILHDIFDQARVLLGLALIGALSAFYGPLRGIICVVLGEALVQVKLVNPPEWFFLLIYPCFLVPLFFLNFKDARPHSRRLLLMFAELGIGGTAFGIVAFTVFVFLTGFSPEILYPQLFAFVISSMATFIPITLLLGLILYEIRQPRVVFSMPLTHHVWEDRDHTVVVHFGGLQVHLCTRCTGMIAGVMGMLVLIDLVGFSVDPLVAIYLCAILPAPGLFIWSGQKFGLWTDKTPSRLLNGVLLGSSIFMISQTRPLFGEMLILLSIYFVLFFVVFLGAPLFLRKKDWLKELEDEDEANAEEGCEEC